METQAVFVEPSVKVLIQAVHAAPQVELDAVHYVSGGIYARELFIPAGVVLVGKVHTKPGIFTLSKGEISIRTQDGLQRIKAPYTGTSEAGCQRVGFAHSDCVFTTYHQTDKLVLDEIEDDLVTETYEQYLERLEKL